jgi:hypothetical protein
MTTESKIRPKPEEEELRQKRVELADLENQLIERELQLISLRQELAAFERLYVQKVGSRYAELDEVEAQIAEILARHSPGDEEVQNVARDARARAEESQSSVAGIVVRENARYSASSSLRSLYREVAKRIHPDLAVDQIDRALRQRLMAEANQAYENGDEERLRAILEEYEISPETVFGDGTGAELVKVIRKVAQVKRRLGEIDAEFQKAKQSELFELKNRVDEGTKLGRDILGDMVASVNSRIGERRSELRKVQEREK